MVGSFLNWIGGGITRTAATALITGLVMVAFGVSPGELMASIWADPPLWLMSGWLRIAILVVGLAIIAASLRFNVWSRKQLAIDSLAQDISEAISDLANARPSNDNEIADWERRYRDWCDKVSQKLQNRAFFTRADQLHFDRLGYIDTVAMTGHPTMDWWHSQLKLKFERLRDVIKSAQGGRR